MYETQIGYGWDSTHILDLGSTHGWDSDMTRAGSTCTDEPEVDSTRTRCHTRLGIWPSRANCSRCNSHAMGIRLLCHAEPATLDIINDIIAVPTL